jgi:hypothetical protein
LRYKTAALENWLRLRFAVNMPYDEIARELITAQVHAAQTDASEPSAAAFFQAAEFKPELLAASTSRVFLGIQLRCAQCHDHPFASWKRQQFWQYAAFLKDTQDEAADPASSAATPIAALEDDSLLIPETKICRQAAIP